MDNGFLQFAFACDESACATWHHVLDVDDDYAVLPYEGALATNGIVSQQTGPPESLPKAALRKTGSVSVEDLERLCLHYNLIDAGFGGLFRESSYDAVWDWSRPSLSVLMSDRWVWNRPSRWVLGSSVWVWNRPSHQFLGSYT